METPTQTIVKSGQPPEVTVKAGDTDIVIRVLAPVEQFRFKKVIGKYIDNPGYMLEATIAASVRSIGGKPMPLPADERGIEFIIEQLGWDGWQAVNEHFVAQAEAKGEKVEVAKN